MRGWAVLAGLIAALAVPAAAQVLENRRPLVFIWAEDIESGRLQPLGSGFVLNAQGDVLTARHVVSGVVQGQRLVVSVSTKSDFPVRVDMADLDCAATQDFCFVRIPPDVVAARGLTAFYTPGCYVPPPDAPLMAAGFFAAGDMHTGVVTPRGAVIGDLVTGRLLPTSIPLEAGMSGGPVFDAAMNVIGLVKGGTTGGQFGFVQLMQPARSLLADRGIDCATRAAAEAPGIGGEWRDQFDSIFRIAVDDGRVMLTGTNGARRMEGAGTLSGRGIALAITNNQEGGTITCSGLVEGEGTIRALCVQPDGGTFDWLLTR